MKPFYQRSTFNCSSHHSTAAFLSGLTGRVTRPTCLVKHPIGRLGSIQPPIFIATLLMSGVLLMGCSPPVPAAPPRQSAPQVVSPSQPSSSRSPSQTATNLGQTLPISAQVSIGNQLIKLEVAQTQQQQATGLMYRTELADDRGMLFPFNPPRRVGFWMKNVAISLDMVFLQNGQVKAIASDVPPCTTEPCPLYGPDVLIDQVIELRGGRATELGLKVGDRLTIQPL